MATTLYSVTAEMISDAASGIVYTTMSATNVVTLAQRKEYWVSKVTGRATTPTDATDLANLQEMVILETAIELANKHPHSVQIGAFRYDKYPQLGWRRRLNELYAQYPSTSSPVPIAIQRWGD